MDKLYISVNFYPSAKTGAPMNITVWPLSLKSTYYKMFHKQCETHKLSHAFFLVVKESKNNRTGNDISFVFSQYVLNLINTRRLSGIRYRTDIWKISV